MVILYRGTLQEARHESKSLTQTHFRVAVGEATGSSILLMQIAFHLLEQIKAENRSMNFSVFFVSGFPGGQIQFLNNNTSKELFIFTTLL